MKLNKGDLIRSCFTHNKGLVLGHHADGITPKVLWLTGDWQGKWTWESPGYLTKMGEQS